MPPTNPLPDIYFTPTPHRVVEVMLDLAGVEAGDVVYDLGCGDGRILVAAALQRGARGVGIDLDPDRIAETSRLAASSAVQDRVTLIREDFFNTDLRPASVVTLYLLDSLNIRLRPRILAQCQPGTRVVSYSFEMGEWAPDEHTPIAANGVSMWLVPANLSGRWRSVFGGAMSEAAAITQRFQMLSGAITLDDCTRKIREGRVAGDQFTLTLEDEIPTILTGKITGDSIDGLINQHGKETPWAAHREPGTMRPVADAA